MLVDPAGTGVTENTFGCAYFLTQRVGMSRFLSAPENPRNQIGLDGKEMPMAIFKHRNRAALSAASLTLGILPLAFASPAFASNSASLTVGPVPLLQAPVTACVDSTCASLPELTSVSLTTTVTVDGSLSPVVLTPTACPSGLGVAVRVTTTQTMSVTLNGLVSGTTTSGPVSVPVGPKTVTITAGTPGVLVSACTS
jgi:hypothetical protein